MNIPWWGYVILAGMAWGTYVPIIFYGGSELTSVKGSISGRLASILCVGIAYFVMAVMIPLVLMYFRDDAKPSWKMNGLVFSSLAGIAGAVGAICVIFASKAAMDAVEAVNAVNLAANPDAPKINPATYRIFIAPLIFSIAPFINTLLSLVWHPKPGNPWHFHFEMPGPMLPIGILFVAVGTFLVLFSKESMEAKKTPGNPPAAVQEKPPEQGAPESTGS